MSAAKTSGWRPKDLSDRALAEASGLVRLRNHDGTTQQWVERAEAEARLDQGSTLT